MHSQNLSSAQACSRVMAICSARVSPGIAAMSKRERGWHGMTVGPAGALSASVGVDTGRASGTHGIGSAAPEKLINSLVSALIV
jgi:hypothetical protein